MMQIFSFCFDHKHLSSLASTVMNNSALNEEIEKDVLPWLRLAEDLRVLQLDVEVTKFSVDLCCFVSTAYSFTLFMLLSLKCHKSV